MPVNVGEIVSTVTTEPEQASQSAEPQQDWQRAADTRSLIARLHKDRLRTAAEGFDD
jgi:hypothetical protein